MNWKWILLTVAFSGVLAIGCASGTKPPGDAGIDAGTDAGTDAGIDGGDEGADASPVLSQTRVNVTGGGGTAASADYKVRVHVGAPQPYGSAESADTTLQAGPRPAP